MRAERDRQPMSTALVRACLVAKARGAAFPTVWRTVLRDHPLVSGRPIRTLKHERARLEIPLATGHWLVHEVARNEYTLEAAPPRQDVGPRGVLIRIDRWRAPWGVDQPVRSSTARPHAGRH